jgi:putative ABC transport system ATP-binding protein
MVTHDPRFARHADRQVHLFDGKVIAEGELSPEQLLQVQ